MNKVYFPNLNGLRFIAAFLVIVHHIEQLKSLFGMENYWSNPFVSVVGKLGVVLFFVLSGFLITYLLLEEEKQMGTISIKDFYIRRVLRIWPLYYLIVILSLFVFPNLDFLDFGGWFQTTSDNFASKVVLFFLFLPNLALILFSPVPYASQTWSVGVEEQFYLLWPILMKKFRNKETLLLSVIGGYLFIKFGHGFINKFWGLNSFFGGFKGMWDTFSIDCMAIGGIFALNLYRKSPILKILYKRQLQWIVLVLLCFLVGLGVRIPYVHYEFYAILFGILILNLASNPFSILNLENRTLNYLGKISYGLYMFHVLGIVIALKVLGIFRVSNFAFQYGLSIFLTVLLAGLSYNYLEKYFIFKKAKFAKVISGDNAVPDYNNADIEAKIMIIANTNKS